MSKIITVDYINSTKFYQLPKAFFHNEIYKYMRIESKVMYSILKDLLELSIKNNWVNENNEVYVKLSREKMMEYLNLGSKTKISQIMKELKEKELIIEKQLGLKKCNEIYVCIPDELDEFYNDNKLLQNKENQLKSSMETSRSPQIGSQKVLNGDFKKSSNRSHTNTNYTKTKKTNTNYKNYKGKKEIPFVDNCETREEYSNAEYLKDIERKLLGWDKKD